MGAIIKQDHTTWCSDSLAEVDLLWAYLAGLKQHLIDEKERFRNEIDTVVLEEHEEYSRIVSFFRGLDDETWALEHVFTQHFPNLLLRTTLVAFYSFAEVTLDNLCDLFARHIGSAVSVRDIKGKGISRAKLYLTKICGIDFGCLPRWSELNSIAKMRNLITHADGRITEANREVQPYIKNCPFLRLDGNEIIISLEYLDHFLEVITDLIGGIGRQIKTKRN